MKKFRRRCLILVLIFLAVWSASTFIDTNLKVEPEEVEATRPPQREATEAVRHRLEMSRQNSLRAVRLEAITTGQTTTNLLISGMIRLNKEPFKNYFPGPSGNFGPNLVQFLKGNGLEFNPPHFLFYNDRKGLLMIHSSPEIMENLKALLKTFVLEEPAYQTDQSLRRALGFER